MLRLRYTQAADFWQERDFGAKISAAFEFIGAHIRPLGKCLVYFVLPPTILLGIFMGVFTNNLRAFATGMSRYPTTSINPFGALGMSLEGLGLVVLGWLLTIIMLSATVYGYLRARLRLPASEVVQPRHVWQAVRARLGWVVLGVLVLGILGVVAFFALGMIMGVVVQAVITSFWGFLFVSLLMMCIVAYLGVSISLYFPVLWLEDQGIFSAVGRSFQLIQKNWWATFALLFVSLLIEWALSIPFSIPLYALTFARGLQLGFLDSDILGIIVYLISSIGSTAVRLLPLLILSFQYFNLVEQHEAFGSMLLLDELGQAPAAQPAPLASTPEYFRPDEEGEY